MRGFLDCWKKESGFGFAYAYSNEVQKHTRYFVHVSSIQDGVVPQAGNWIEFDPGMTVKGPVALNVRVLSRAEAVAAMLSMGSAK